MRNSFSTSERRYGQYITVLPTIASLRSYSTSGIKDGDAVTVTGYQSVGDANGGIYTWVESSSEADDSNNIIRANDTTTGRWKLAVGVRGAIIPPTPPAVIPYYTATKTIVQKLDEIVALDDFRQPTDTTDDAALQRAIDLGFRKIYLRGGKGLGANGMYLIGTYPWTGVIPGRPANSTNALDYIEYKGNLSTTAGAPAHGLHLYGDGMGKTVVYQGDNNYLFMHNSLTPDTTKNLMGFRLEKMTLKGTNTGPNGAQHTIALAGVTDFVCDEVEWLGFNSDGVILWMGQRPDTVRHNYNARFWRCKFNGINNKNRNAISIEDCVGWVVSECTFDRCCAYDDLISVACIDIEPRDRDTYQNGDGYIINNTFKNSGRAAVAFYINAADSYQVKTRSFVMTGNNIESCFRGFDLSGDYSPITDVTSGTRDQILIAFNRLKNCDVSGRMRGALGVDYVFNQHDNVGTFYMGLDNTGLPNAECRIDHNYFYGAGRSLGAVLLVDDPCRDCSFSNNRIYESGRVDNLGGWVMLARYGSVGLRLNDNVIINTSGRIKAFAQMAEAASVGTRAQKVRNEIYPTAPSASDNFNPSPPPQGVYQEYVLTTGATFGANSLTYFDITVPGATTNRFWKCRFKDYPSTSAVISTDAQGQQFGVVRAIVRNTGAAWSAPAGTTIIIAEAQS